MQNHGLLTAGGTVGEAASFFITCRDPALRSYLSIHFGQWASGSGAPYIKEGTGKPSVMYMQFEPEYNFLKETGGVEFLLGRNYERFYK